MCVGDIHNIAEEVKKFDPHYSLELNPRLGKYQVLEHRTRKLSEGTYNGFPLFSFQDVCEIVMTVEYINAEKEAPDMRIIQDLHMKDVWNYPGGPKAFYDDMMRKSEKNKQKREENINDMVQYAANERYKYVLREHQGAPDMKTIHQGVSVNAS
jgi:hypothetical protein